MVKASLRTTGSTLRSLAMAGNEVAITVESIFSMKRAEATTSGMMRENSAIRGLRIA